MGSEAEAEEFLSPRGLVLANHSDFFGRCFAAYLKDAHSFRTNPDGIICMGTAENFLNDDLLLEKLNRKESIAYEPWMMHYYRYHGVPDFLSSAAAFITKYFKSRSRIREEELVGVLGTCATFDIVAHCVAEPGDVFLCQTPIYTRIQNDLHERALVDLYPIPLSSRKDDNPLHPFQLTLEKTVAAYASALREGKRVRGIVLVNPNNPLCTVLEQDALLAILQWAAKEKLWVIADEIYALGMLDDHVTFRSVLSVELPDPSRTVWTWGLSKDLGLPGMRASFMHCANQALLGAARKLIAYQCVPAPLQLTVGRLLSDHLWMDSFLAENRRRILGNLALVKETLGECGVDLPPPAAGLFVFADLRRLLPTPDFEARGQNTSFFVAQVVAAHCKLWCGEEKMVEGEAALFESLFGSEKVFLVPGKELFCPEPGWFRITYTIRPDKLREGLRRIRHALKAAKPTAHA